MITGVSVIVCCYNSSKRIIETLRHLSLQQVDANLSWEIILVDNASSDNTAEAAKEYWSRLNNGIELNVVREPKPGLSYARKRGIDVSRYDVLILCDDDNWLHESYVQTVTTILSNQAIGAVGGRGVINEIPKWLEGYESYYAIGPQGKHSGDTTNINGCLYGAGLAIRKDVFTRLDEKKFYSVLSDRTGKNLMSGGDTELTFAIRLLGYELWYDERLTFYHAISKERFTLSYFIKLVFYIGYSWMALYPYHQVLNQYRSKYPAPSWADLAYVLKRLTSSFLKSIFFLIVCKFSKAKENAIRLIFQFGELVCAVVNFKTFRTSLPFLQNLR